MTERNWRTMTDEEFADWFRNLKLKALDATEDERTRQARSYHEQRFAKRAGLGASPNSPSKFLRELADVKKRRNAK
jgi:hypothetical protein